MIYNLTTFNKGFETQLNELIDESFGQGFSATKNFFDPDFKVVCLQKEGELIGAAGLLIKGDLGVLDFIIVSKENRGKGLGSRLLEEKIKKANDYNLNQLEINHWVRKNVLKPFYAVNYGFEKVESTNDFWSKESLKYMYNCDECGKPPCSCTRDLYSLNLKP